MKVKKIFLLFILILVTTGLSIDALGQNGKNIPPIISLLLNGQPAQPPVPVVVVFNDTGITDCIGGTGEEDCNYGRDVTDCDDTDGHAGFSFTKLDNTGTALAQSATSWACVKDNVTGLIWEVKTDTAGMHYKNDVFSWYNTDTTTNGGAEGIALETSYCDGFVNGTSETYCNTEAFVNRVNSVGLCGATDWRMPTIKELQGIVAYDRFDWTVDQNYFPGIPTDITEYDKVYFYWSGDSVAKQTATQPEEYKAWQVNFLTGQTSDTSQRDAKFHVRLVREPPVN